MQQKDPVRIIVNAQERVIPLSQLSTAGEVSYEKLITLAFNAGTYPLGGTWCLRSHTEMGQADRPMYFIGGRKRKDSK